MALRLSLVSLALLAALAGAASAAAVGDADVAALQVALHGQKLYGGTIDGLLGPRTDGALRAFQRRSGVPDTGQVGPLTRAALGASARPALGSRLLRKGRSGWDVSALQFLLAWRGFPSGPFDGVFGDRVEAALLAFQEWAGVPMTGQAGSLTLAALRAPLPRSPLRLSWPLVAPVGDGFGPRGDRFHSGIDLPAPSGTPVGAAGVGVVVEAGWHDGGFGNQVVVDHGSGVTSRYDHLSRVDVTVGRIIEAGDRIGLVGATGHATGPHLHFEVRVRGAAVDPLTALT